MKWPLRQGQTSPAQADEAQFEGAVRGVTQRFDELPQSTIRGQSRTGRSPSAGRNRGLEVDRHVAAGRVTTLERGHRLRAAPSTTFESPEMLCVYAARAGVGVAAPRCGW